MIVYLTYRGLYHNYKSGKLFRADHPAARKYAFFVNGYRKETFYWEAVVMARKLSIVCLSVVLSPTLQLAWAMMFVGISLIGTTHLLPFEDRFVNRVETASLVALCITILIGFHYQTLHLNNETDIIPTVFLLLIDGTFTIFLLACCFVRARRYVAGTVTYMKNRYISKGNEGAIGERRIADIT